MEMRQMEWSIVLIKAFAYGIVSGGAVLTATTSWTSSLIMLAIVTALVGVATTILQATESKSLSVGSKAKVKETFCHKLRRGF
jgi:hypothetical protein